MLLRSWRLTVPSGFAMVDQTLIVAARDVRTVDASGASAPGQGGIEGVLTRAPIEHVDHRGTVFEIFNEDPDYWRSPAAYAYQFSIRPGQVKGWGLHQHHEDRYIVISGEVLTVLYDVREGSSTFQNVQQVVLSPRGNRQPEPVRHPQRTPTSSRRLPRILPLLQTTSTHLTKYY